jgi:hypothetical protein
MDAAPFTFNYADRSSVLVNIAMTGGISHASRIRRILKFFENFNIENVKAFDIKETFNMLEVFDLVVNHQDVLKKLRELAVKNELWRLFERIHGNSWAYCHMKDMGVYGWGVYGWRELVLLLVLLECCPSNVDFKVWNLIQGASLESAKHASEQFLKLRGAGYAQRIAFEDGAPMIRNGHTFMCTRCGGDPKKKVIGCCADADLQMLTRE